MKDGAIICNTGHFNVEIDIPALRELAVETREARNFVEEFTLADGRRRLPARRRAARQHLGRRGPSGDRDGHELRQPGARDRVRRPERGVAREQGLPGADRDRRGDRPAQARDDGRRRSTSSPRSRRSTSRPGTRGPSRGRCSNLSRSSGSRHDRVVLLDQRRLPLEEVEVECRTAAEVADAIRSWSCAARRRSASRRRTGTHSQPRAARTSARPTAVLRGVPPDRRQPRLGARPDARRSVGRARPRDPPRRGRALPAMAAHAAELFAPGTRALTHCNAGGLATGGYGSAVGALDRGPRAAACSRTSGSTRRARCSRAPA